MSEGEARFISAAAEINRRAPQARERHCPLRGQWAGLRPRTLNERDVKTMLDIKFVRENPELVKQNIKNKFQEGKLALVDEVIELDKQNRAAITEADQLRADRNRLSKMIGGFMAKGEKDKAEETKKLVAEQAQRLAELEKLEAELQEKIKTIMYTIPNIIDQACRLARTTRKMLRFSVTASLLCPILTSHITPILWKDSTASTLTRQDVLQATVSITSWVTLQDFTRQLSLMPVIL